jgi:hypothetical protein
VKALLERFVAWLARHEIARIRAEDDFQSRCACLIHEQAGYMKGYGVGVLHAFQAMTAIAHERAGAVTLEDIEQAKKRTIN